MLWQSEVWPCTGYRTHTLTELRLSVYLIVLFILNFISVPNEIFVVVGICNFNLLISLIFMPILFRNLLFLINVKFAHFSVLYTIIYYGENKNICTRCERYIVHVRPKIYLKSLKRSWNIGYRRYRILIIVKSSNGKSVEPFARNLSVDKPLCLWLLFAQYHYKGKVM